MRAGAAPQGESSCWGAEVRRAGFTWQRQATSARRATLACRCIQIIARSAASICPLSLAPPDAEAPTRAVAADSWHSPCHAGKGNQEDTP